MIVASIDIGTNTVLLLIASVDSSTKIITPMVDKISMPRLGKGLVNGNKFPDENLLRLYTVLNDYANFIKSHSCEVVFICATNAFRIAANHAQVVEEVKRVFNLNIEIITGETEAWYSYLGALSNSENKNGSLVIDIGGGSTEIIIGSGHSIHFRKSFPIGVVALSEKYLLSHPPSATEIHSMNHEIESIVSELKTNHYKFSTSIAVAGTPTTLACIKNHLLSFDVDKIEGSFLTTEDIDKMIIQLSHLTFEEMRSKFGNVVEGREDILLSGTLILRHLMNLLSIKQVVVSTRGIRYGVIVNYLTNN